jgi:ribulose-5-phosphate 4-epimerase/fuculose-1-phosphate aldolase
MTMTESETRADVVRTAKMMAAAGLAEAFGHVSARWRDGFIITSVDPFVSQDLDDLLYVDDPTQPPSGGGRAPLETPMHAAIYLARPDVESICRGHPPSVVTWGVRPDDLPLLHGLGAMAGQRVAVHTDVDLISTSEQASAVASTLGDESSVILRSNGCLSVGADGLEALTRLYFLEERARVALDPRNQTVRIDWGKRLRHTPPELDRAKTWVQAAFGKGL